MARRKLITEPSTYPDLFILGINSQMKDYRLAYYLNREASLSLARLDDLPVFSEKDNQLPEYPLYKYSDTHQRTHYYLIGNNHPITKMVPAYKQADYLLMLRGSFEEVRINTLTQSTRKINGVQLVFNIDLSKLKNLEGIMSDLELHLLGR
ncbi:MAG: hypothetical protein CVT94_04475 [Bacteroidetes bacterium HGW-Bacteroidetes-11]|jgi:hypothetical protein|nr:MAG: hypothetical protein CVT94_04475 [Bacteroidetes bacterium HGW-Bacteroidetes-11]